MIRVRPAEPEDGGVLLEWRNDPDTVAASGTPMPVAAAAHARWLSAVLADPFRVLYIAELDSDDRPRVGMCRFDLTADGSSAEVSINLAPSHRGQGLSRTLLEAGIAQLRSDHPGVGSLDAKIRHRNTASRRLFESLGFEFVSRDPEFDEFALALD